MDGRDEGRAAGETTGMKSKGGRQRKRERGETERRTGRAESTSDPYETINENKQTPTASF